MREEQYKDELMDESDLQDIDGAEIAEDQEVADSEQNQVHYSHHGHHHHHHHHHHGERSHHRRHHKQRHRKNSSSQKKNNKFVAFLKKHRSVLINILSCTVSVVLIIIIALYIDFSKPVETESVSKDITKSTVKIETSIYREKVSLVNDAVHYYLNPDNASSANEVYKSFDGHKNSLNVGLPLSFEYSVTGLPGDAEVQSAVLEISENNDYRDALTYKLDPEDPTLDIYNLKTGTKYYYRVNLTLADAVEIGTTGSFETEASPRILNIDGACNARDIGGWHTADGKIIGKGLLYRGSEIDGAVEPDYKITDRGLQQMIGELGVRFDMDLRSPDENKYGNDILGKNVIHKYYGVGMYSAIFKNEEKLKEIFSDLANPDNYPIYLHCTYGRDRTGTVCYLLEALLGVSDSDLKKEYEISALTDSYVNTPEFNAFVETVRMFEGTTTQQKVEGYLLSIGVTEDEIASIRSIFLEQN